MDDCLADLFFFGGKIVVMDEANSEAEALAVKDGKIVSVGKYKDVNSYVGPNTQIIKLVDDQTLLPGFIEAHTHAVHMVWIRCLYENISAHQFSCYEEIKCVIAKKVREAACACPVEWCLFWGWDPELISDLPDLSADRIDAEFCQHLHTPIPIVVVGQNGHVAWANKAALDEANICSDNPPDGFVLEKGKLTGQIFEFPNIKRVVKCMTTTLRLDRDIIKKATREQWKDYASRGFTTVTELYYVANDMIKEALSDVADEENCPIRLALYECNAGSPVSPPEPNQTGKPVQSAPCCSHLEVKSTDIAAPSASLARNSYSRDNNKLWVAGVKLFADGSPHCGTMAVDAPFLSNDLTHKLGFPTIDSPCGKLNYKHDELLKLIRCNHDRQDQPQIAVHAHGERAIDQVLSIYKKVDPPDSDRRHRMEHLGLMTEEQIAQAAEQNLALSFFVCQLYFYGKTFAESILGPDRTNRWTPLALAKKYGLRWASIKIIRPSRDPQLPSST